MTRSSVAVLLSVILLFPLVSAAQVSTGTPPFGTFNGGPADTVNVGNLNIQIKAPIVSRPGRGIPFNYDLTYNSSLWYPSSTGWKPADNWGWPGQSQGIPGFVNFTRSTTLCYGSNGYPIGSTTYIGPWTYYEPDGTTHLFNGSLIQVSGCPGNSVTSFTAVANDNSGMVLQVTNNGGSVVLIQKDGTQISVPKFTADPNAGAGSTKTDSNGNRITSTGTNQSTTYTDTLGNQALTISGYAPNNVTFTYPGPQGDVATTVSYTLLPIKTNFQCRNAQNQLIPEYTSSGNVPLLTRILLPDGTDYVFTYETTPGFAGYRTGRIASVKVPTGGTITYTYTGGNNGINCTDGSTAGLNRYTPDSANPWQYVRTQLSSSGAIRWQTAVTDPAMNQTTYKFEVVGSSFYEEQRVVKTGATVEQTVETCYNTKALSGGTCTTNTTPFTLPITQVDVYRRLPSTSGVTSRTTTKYDSTYSRVTEVTEYDFGNAGSGTEGTALRQTTISYATISGIFNRPYQVQTKKNQEGSWVLAAQTSYGYDNRGNTINISYWTGISALNQGFGYNANGSVATATDVNRTLTTYSYGDGSCNGAFPTGVSVPVGGVTLTTSTSWNCAVGAPNWTKDENDQQTSFSYDSLYRLTGVNRPDGGSTSYDYNAGARSVTQTDAIDATKNFSTTTYYDLLGRPTESRITSDPDGTIHRVTTYNSIGQVASVTNPYRSINDSTYGITQYSYDALGRTTQIKRPDNNTVLYSYSGMATSIQDEGNGTRRVQRIYQNDGLGRLKSVCEVTSTTLIGLNPTPASCQLNISGNGFLTTYEYDVLSNLTRVVQGGLNNRVMFYDGLSRLTSETIPEVSNVTYVYNSNGDLYQRARPSPNQTGSYLTTATYSYDNLHRLTRIEYSDQNPSPPYVTPGVVFNYDQANAWGLNLQNTKGRLSQTEGGSGNNYSGSVLTYDSMGRIVGDWQKTPYNPNGPAWYLGYTYDLAGNMLSMASNGGVTLNYSYNTAAQLLSVASNINDPYHPTPLLADVEYNALGQVVSARFGNGISLDRTYNSRGMLVSATDGSVWSATGITYKPNGNIASANDTQNGNWSYTYDDFNRLKTSVKTGQSFTYEYDRYGNRWQQNGGPGPAPQYTFDANNRIEPGNGVLYDAAGNVTNDGVHSYTYDAEGRLVSVDGGSTAQYVYDATGRRIQTRVGTVQKDSVYDVNGREFLRFNNAYGWADRWMLYSGGWLFATYANGTTYFAHTDWLGTRRLETDASGNLVANYTSLPFGDGQGGSGGDRFWFADIERDNESNLEHAWFRQYSSTQGRWMSPDPAGLAAADPSAPQSWNRYSYVTNNPANMIDPSGLDAILTIEQYCGPRPSAQCSADYGRYMSAPYAGGGTGPRDVWGRVGILTGLDVLNLTSSQTYWNDGWHYANNPTNDFVNYNLLNQVSLPNPFNAANNGNQTNNPNKYNQWKSCIASAKSKRNSQLVGSIGTSVLSSFALTGYAFVLITNPELATLETLPHTAVPLAAPAVTYMQSIQATTNILNEHDQYVAACNAAAGYAFN